ncbi:MAG: sulfatase-like hydrolase/transferase [Fuerstiella sp.]
MRNTDQSKALVIALGALVLATASVQAQSFQITTPPSDLKLKPFYQKYVSANGYPIVSSVKVDDYALKEAAFLVNLMLANRPDVRKAMIKSGSRLIIMAHDEFTTDVPEHSHMRSRDYWDARARGLGGSRSDPVCSCGQENLLAFDGDPYSTENILIHEFAHNIHLRGLVNVDPTFDDRLKQAYQAAMSAGLWDRKYASTNHAEYFAEGVQSWFDNNRQPDHDHNHVDTRKELRDYDPGLAAVCEEVFGETELVYTKPATRLKDHLAGYDPAKAPRFVWPERLLKVKEEIREKARNRKSRKDKQKADNQSNAANPTRPNIVVIMADDLGWMDLHCQGNALLDTPHLDRLATQGMRFTDGYAAAPVCSPTRAAMMTGQSPARVGLTNHAPGHADGFHPPNSETTEADWVRHLTLDHVTIAERLREAGYATGFIGKWHLSHRPGSDANGPFEPRLRPEHQGYQVNVGGCSRGGPPSYFEPYRIPNIAPRRTGEYLADRLADESIAFIEAHKDEPFFLTWWNYSVHYPMEAPADLIKKYRNREGISRPVYAAMIEAMDAAIGKLLTALDRSGVSQNTLLIFKSDNGSLYGNAPLRANKGFLYEGGIRVPWIVRWPGIIEAGSVCSTPVISMDTFPTILEAAGLKPASNMPLDGESLLPLLKQTGSLQRKAIYFHYPNYAFHKQNRLGSAIREGDFKLITRYDDSSFELYNLANDISEKQDLAKSSPEIAMAMKAKLDAWLAASGARMPGRISGTN